MKMKKRTATKLAAALLCAAMLLTAFPLTSFARNNRTNALLRELSEGLQDGSDAYAFAPGSAQTQEPVGYPQAFDLRNVDTDADGVGDTGYVTPVKSQSPFGTCWSFGATTASETSILGDPELSRGLTSDTLDLSEKHTAWFVYEPIKDESSSQFGEGGHYVARKSGEQLNNGGWTFCAASLYASGAGPVCESRDAVLEYCGKEKLVVCSGIDEPYEEADVPQGVEKRWYSKEDDWSIPDSCRFMQDFRLRESYALPLPREAEDDVTKTMAINAIKEQLFNKRGVAFSYCANGQYMNDKTWAHYVYQDTGVTHAVCIVGWDDNYPRENFIHADADGWATPAPEHNGAWLVKNSWGSEEREFPHKSSWGMQVGQDKYPYAPASEDALHTGYFWISYEDKSISCIESYAYEKVPEEPTSVYQYDFMPVSGVNSASLNTQISTANIFCAETDGKVEQISCQTTTPGTEVQYTVYLLNKGAQDPTDGKVIAEMNATYPYGGFHKETLPDPPVVRKGQRFAVTVTQKTPDDRYAFSLQIFFTKNNYDRMNDEIEKQNEILKKENERIERDNAVYLDADDEIMARVKAAFERDESVDAYNREIDSLNSVVGAYNAMVDEYNERIAAFMNDLEGEEDPGLVWLEHMRELNRKWDTYAYYRGVVNKGESMFRIDDKWLDLSNAGLQELLIRDVEYQTLDNFPIKAFVTQVDLPDELTLHSSADDQTGNRLEVTVPYAGRGALATQLTAGEEASYSSSDPDLLQVDENGNVTFVRLCMFCRSVTITATSVDRARTAECTVRIRLKWWQYLIWFLFGSLWY